MAETTPKTSAKKAPTKPAAVKPAALATPPAVAKPAVVAKPVAAKPVAAAKPLAAKVPSAKVPSAKPATKKSLGKAIVLTDEQRYRMVAEAAYYRAESNQFRSDPLRDWIDAESDISALLNGDSK